MTRSNLLFGAEWKSAGDSGELEGYVSVFGNVDQGGDVVLPGAFKRTLAHWAKSRQPLPLIADHQLTTEGVIGSVTKASEDGYGLRVHARFSSDPKAQSVRMKMVEGHVNGMSFTYEPVDHYRGEKDGKQVRYLRELRLFEATVTPFPMNALALANAKAEELDPSVESNSLDDAAWEKNMAKVLEIPWGPARKAAMTALLAEYNLNHTARDLADGQATADAPTGTDDSLAGTAKTGNYASRFVASTLGLRDDAPDGDPPVALADPLIPIRVERQTGQLDRLEAAINRAKEANR